MAFSAVSKSQADLERDWRRASERGAAIEETALYGSCVVALSF